VTIGVCLRNEEDDVEETLRSIFQQDFPHELMELIIVDDGSEDETLSLVIRDVTKVNMKVTVFHSGWRGIGEARNTVVNNAKGQYIIWVDGGMKLPNNHVSQQVEFMEKYSDAGIAKAKCGASERQGTVSILESLQFVAVDSRYDGKVKSFVVGTGGSTYRVGALRQVGVFDINLKRSGEDLDMEERMRDKGWSVYRTSALYYKKHNETWKSFWFNSVKYGYGGHYLIHKHMETIAHRSIVTWLDGMLNARTAYRLTGRKLSFLLIPFQFLDRTAWFWGFLRAHIHRYEPRFSPRLRSKMDARVVYSR
jgi:glycosyltransferase involved in cell wall biosynthesis